MKILLTLLIISLISCETESDLKNRIDKQGYYIQHLKITNSKLQDSINDLKYKLQEQIEYSNNLKEGIVSKNPNDTKYYYEYYVDFRAFEDGIAKIMSGKDNATFRQFIQRVVENE